MILAPHATTSLGMRGQTNGDQAMRSWSNERFRAGQYFFSGFNAGRFVSPATPQRKPEKEDEVTPALKRTMMHHPDLPPLSPSSPILLPSLDR